MTSRETPWTGGPWEPFPLPEPYPPPLPSPWQGAGRNVLFFFLTVACIFTVGSLQYGIGGGARLLVSVMSILMAHEMGHYVACRYYRVDATLPYFIPFPIHMVGTLGAFIRIRGRFPHRKALFDIGIAGPLAGIVVCLPVLALGIMEGRVGPTPGATYGRSMGEPLLFQWFATVLKGPIPDDATLFIGPVGMAAWFGLLMTALNLMPIGQLDGGHVMYALFRRWSLWISRAGLLAALVLVYHQPTWLVWTILLFLLGRRLHPPTLQDSAPLGLGRVMVGVLGLVVFVVCFTPQPVVVTWPEFLTAWRDLGVWLWSLPYRLFT